MSSPSSAAQCMFQRELRASTDSLSLLNRPVLTCRHNMGDSMGDSTYTTRTLHTSPLSPQSKNCFTSAKAHLETPGEAWTQLHSANIFCIIRPPSLIPQPFFKCWQMVTGRNSSPRWIPELPPKQQWVISTTKMLPLVEICWKNGSRLMLKLTPKIKQRACFTTGSKSTVQSV